MSNDARNWRLAAAGVGISLVSVVAASGLQVAVLFQQQDLDELAAGRELIDACLNSVSTYDRDRTRFRLSGPLIDKGVGEGSTSDELRQAALGADLLATVQSDKVALEVNCGGLSDRYKTLPGDASANDAKYGDWLEDTSALLRVLRSEPPNFDDTHPYGP